ncbi:unnamed protein product [Calypogeia fissa]
MADSSPLGSCSLDRLAQLFQEILKMQSQKSVCSRIHAGKATGRQQCVTCNDPLQCCSHSRLANPTKRRNESGQLDDCCQTSTKGSCKRAKVETIQLKKDFKETSKEELESLRLGAEMTCELGCVRDRLDDSLESFRGGDVIFVLEDSETDGFFHENQSNRFVIVSPDIYFS